MKKTKRTLAAFLSAMMAAVLVTGSAMAAQDITGAALESLVGVEDEMARLRRLNPYITEEQWEMAERLEYPEMNGLILVDETQELEDGQLVVFSYYTDAINSISSGKSRYYATTRMFSNGTTDGILILKTYLSAEFEYDSESDYLWIVPNSKSAFSIKEIDSQYPIIKDGDPHEDNSEKINEYYVADQIGTCTKYALIYETIVLWSYSEKKTYSTTLTVGSDGRQYSKRFQDIKP